MGLLALFGAPLVIALSSFICKVNDKVLIYGGRNSWLITNYKCKYQDHILFFSFATTAIAWLVLAIVQTEDSINGIGLMMLISLSCLVGWNLPALFGKAIAMFQKRGS